MSTLSTKVSFNKKLKIEQYHIILRDFLPVVLNHIILEYTIFSTQETFVRSINHDIHYEMVCSANIVYKYDTIKQSLSKYPMNTETYIFSSDIIIHKYHVYVLDGYSIYVFDKKLKRIKNYDKTYIANSAGMFIYNDKLNIIYTYQNVLNYSDIDEKNIHDIKFEDKIYSVKFINKYMYVLLWNNNIIKYSFEHMIKTLAYKHFKHSNYNNSVLDFCVHDEHIYIVNLCGNVIIYDHNTNFIRIMNTLKTAESINYHNEKLYIGYNIVSLGFQQSRRTKIYDVYEINYNKIPYFS